MIAVDSSAIIAVLFGEAEAEAILSALVTADRRLMSAVSVLERGMVAQGRAGSSGRDELRRLIAAQDIEVVAFTPDLADLALDAFTRFGKGRHPAGLNMGDCASYALAASRRLPLLFKGDDFSRTDIGRVL